MLGESKQFQKLIFVSVGIIALIIGAKALRVHREEVTKSEIIISKTSSEQMWTKVSGVVMPDIITMGFDKTGRYGAVVSLEGFLMKTNDGGNNWFEAGYIPLEDGDIPNAIAVKADGKLVIGIGVDESAYTAIYQETDNSNWKQTKCVDCGGIFAGSSDGSMFVGGGGLIINQNDQSNQNNRINESNRNNQINVSYLPDWGKTTLYGVAQNHSDNEFSENSQINNSINQNKVSDNNKILVVGESNLVAISESDNKWNVISPPTGKILPFYAGAINSEKALVGGVNGSLWQFEFNSNKWRQIKGLKEQVSVLSMLIAENEMIVAGGELAGKAFIISSKGNDIWQYDLLPKGVSKIVCLAITNKSILAATSDGYILKRTKSSVDF